MLSLTRKTDYALIAMAAMARKGNGTLSARDIAEQSGVSARLLTNILNRLKHEGLVLSTRGMKGGYALAKSPERITLSDLIEAVEGPVRLARCCTVNGAEPADGCDLEGTCLTKNAVRRLHGSLRHFLGQVTLRDLAWDTVALKVDVTAGNGKYAGPPPGEAPCSNQSAVG